MTNLVVDVGNTNTKLFLFQNDKIMCKCSEPNDLNFFSTKTIELLQKNNIENCIISAVNELNDKKDNFLDRNFNTIYFNPEIMNLPIKIEYKTPNTLGHDRVANVCGASILFPNHNTLVIDAGTAITYDILENGKVYKGGNISPGIQTRFKSLHTFTDKLPLLSMNINNVDNLYGNSTIDAIITGVQNGVKYEVIATINAFEEVYSNLKVIFTGGDAFFFENSLKKCIFVEPNITAIGLNEILNINV